MSKVTRIAYSKDLNQGKFDHLSEMARRLGQLRTEAWDKFGSMAGVGLSHRDVRDAWVAQEREFDLPARVWKQTLSDVFGDMEASREAAKLNVKRAIWRKYPNKKDTTQNKEGKRLFTLLKANKWTEDDYLRRLMRRYYHRGHTSVNNQIVLDTQCYEAFKLNGALWINVTSLVPRQRIAIPLNTTVAPNGTIRLILRAGRVEVHYAVEAESVTSQRPHGDSEIGVDKGYTEVFTDSEGDRHGDGLGKLLSKESDELKIKHQRRGKLHAVARKHKKSNADKYDRIRANNLGRKKLNRRKKRHQQNVRNLAFKAAHAVVDKANKVAAEELTAPMAGKSYGKNQNRRLNTWTKGVMAEALNAVTQRRRSSLVLVNPAYTSQMDSRYGVLLGERRGDLFYCFDGVVLDADQNAAANILARLSDTGIHLYMPYKQVKDILLQRTARFKETDVFRSGTVGTAQPGLQLQ